MPTFSINTDTLTTLQPYTGASTVQTVLENTIFAVANSYKSQFGSTDINDALGDYLATQQEARDTGMVRQIRRHAAGLLAGGVAAPGGKFIACSQPTVDNLTAVAALTAAQIGSITFGAVDGTRWPVNTPARANTLLTAMNARVTSVNNTRDSAITNFQGMTQQQKKDFQFSSIVWP